MRDLALSTCAVIASLACSMLRLFNTSISALLAQQIATLVGNDDAYEQAQRRALALLDRGFHLGGRIEATREEWHER